MIGFADRRIPLNACDNSVGSGNRGRFAAGNEVTAFADVAGSFIFKPVSNVAIMSGGATCDDHVAETAAQTTPVRARSAATPGSAAW
jgi:hypothetical protein